MSSEKDTSSTKRQKKKKTEEIEEPVDKSVDEKIEAPASDSKDSKSKFDEDNAWAVYKSIQDKLGDDDIVLLAQILIVIGKRKHNPTLEQFAGNLLKALNGEIRPFVPREDRFSTPRGGGFRGGFRGRGRGSYQGSYQGPHPWDGGREERNESSPYHPHRDTEYRPHRDVEPEEVPDVIPKARKAFIPQKDD